MPQTTKLGRPPTGQTPVRTIRVPQPEWSRWHLKARQEQKTITQWLRDIANRAARSKEKEQ